VGAALKNWAGSMGELSTRTSKWVCGPVELPEEPTNPIS
jgi:hypothetical protein